MSETPNSNDRAERLRRLQERRAGAPSAKRRRRHPAGTTRILLAGLSVTSFFAVGGAIALANQTPQVAQPASTGLAATTGSTTATATTKTGATAARPGTATNVVAHTTTGGS